MKSFQMMKNFFNEEYEDRRLLIKEGDTLGSIAKKFRISVKQLKAWNGLKSDMIRAGKTLKIGT